MIESTFMQKTIQFQLRICPTLCSNLSLINILNFFVTADGACAACSVAQKQWRLGSRIDDLQFRATP